MVNRNTKTPIIVERIRESQKKVGFMRKEVADRFSTTYRAINNHERGINRIFYGRYSVLLVGQRTPPIYNGFIVRFSLCDFLTICYSVFIF